MYSKEPVRKWYVLRTFSGQEKKVVEALQREIVEQGLEDLVTEILLPTETVFEVRSGKKRTREKTFYPGYVFLKGILNTQVKHVISGMNGIMGFLSTGNDGQPTPLRPDEVDRMIGRMDEAAAKGEQPEVPFLVGDAVKVVQGPFNNFNGVIEEVYPDKMKVKVMVSIFGRRTPIELDYIAVEREE